MQDILARIWVIVNRQRVGRIAPLFTAARVVVGATGGGATDGRAASKRVFECLNAVAAIRKNADIRASGQWTR